MNRIAKKISVIALLSSVALISAVASSNASKLYNLKKNNGISQKDQRGIVIIDTVHDYNLDPHTASYTTEAQLLTGLYEGLFSYDPITLEPKNAICQSYKTSSDKLRWTFTLEKNVKFSDGSPITAETIKTSWINLLKTPDAPFASLLDCIEGAEGLRKGEGDASNVKIRAKDDYTLIVTLREPTEHLPSILCHHALSAVSERDAVYSGPYTLKSYAQNKLELVKNQKYRDRENVNIPSITILQSDDEVENAHLFNTGEADWVISNASIQHIINPNAINITAEFGTTYLFFKQNNKKWNTKEFRKALLQAIPYNKLRKDYAVPATTLVYPLSNYPKVAGIDDTDEEEALELAKKARIKAGIGETETIQIIFAIADSEYMKRWASILKEAWEPLGVSLVVQVTPFERYNDSIPGWNADIFSYSWIGDYADPLAFLELFRGGSSLNVSGYSDSRYDSLLSEAAKAESAKDHYKSLSLAEQYLLNDSMVIPISHPISLHIIDKDSIGGWQANALDIHPLKYLYIKPRTTKVPNVVLKELEREQLLSLRL